MRIPLTVAMSLLAVPAVAATDPCPDGRPGVVRVSKITPGGSMAGFQEAARDHLAWYKSHGMATTQFVAPVLVYSPAAKAMVISKTDVMTVRIGPAEVPRDKQDAAWAAFIAKYRANSTIASETRACFPKTLP